MEIGTLRRTSARAIAIPVLVGLAAVLAPHAGQAAHAAGSWTAIVIDGSPGERLTKGAHLVYRAPDAAITTRGASPEHSSVTLASDVDAWGITVYAPTGRQLIPANQDTSSPPASWSYGVLLSGLGRTCNDDPTGNMAQIRIHEITWDADGTPLTFAADAAVHCFNEWLYVSLRYRATTPYHAIVASAPSIDLGTTLAGTPGTPATVTITNVGETDETLGEAALLQNLYGGLEITDDACAGTTLAAGASCDIAVRLTGPTRGLVRQTLWVPDSTPRTGRAIEVHGVIQVETAITLALARNSGYWPHLTTVIATVEPKPDAGDVSIWYENDAGEWVRYYWDAWLSRGDHRWKATYAGDGASLPSFTGPITIHTGQLVLARLTSTQNPSRLGETAVLHAEVWAVMGDEIPAGTLTVRYGGTVLASHEVGGTNGGFDFEVPGLALGRHSITAEYVTSDDGSPAEASLVQAVSTAGIDAGWSAEVLDADGEPVEFGRLAVAPDGIFAAATFGKHLAGAPSDHLTEIVVAKFGLDGSLAWAVQFGTDRMEELDSIATDGAGGVYVSGATGGSFTGQPGAGYGLRGFVAHLTASGAVAWTREAATYGGGLWSVAPLPDGGVAVAGSDLRVNDGVTLAFVRRLTSDGRLSWSRDVSAWSRTDGKQTGVFVSSLASDPGGITLGAGTYGTLEKGATRAGANGFIRRYDLGGHRLWTRDILPAAGLQASAGIDLVVAGPHGLLVTGGATAPLSSDLPPAYNNPWAREYGYDGSLRWTTARHVSGAAARCSGFVLTASTGFFEPSSAGSAYVTGTGGSGAEVWRLERVSDSTGNWWMRDAGTLGARVFILEAHATEEGTTGAVRELTGVPAATACDSVAPSVGRPSVRLTTGALSGGRVPARISWTARDTGTGIAGARVETRLGTAGWRLAGEGSGTSPATVFLPIGAARRLRVAVVDRSGNSAASPVVAWQAAIRQETSAGVTRSGTWRSRSAVGPSGGRWLVASRAGASVTLRATGRSFAWIAAVGPAYGDAIVYVDGVRVKRVRLHAPAEVPGRVVFTHTWARSGTHQIRIVVVGTGSRRLVGVDGFVVAR